MAAHESNETRATNRVERNANTVYPSHGVSSLDPYSCLAFVLALVKSRTQRILGQRPVRVLVLGAGTNFYTRVAQALAPYAARGFIEVVVADCNPNALHRRQAKGLSYVQVRDDDHCRELMSLCDLLLIQTWQKTHPHLIRLAISAKVPVVICEKPAGDTVPRCVGLVDDVRRAFPMTIVLFHDHYATMACTLNALALAAGTVQPSLGPIEVQDASIILREKVFIPPDQVISQAQGAKEPLHHAFELLRCFVGLSGWESAPCWRASHPASPITSSTYAAISLVRSTTKQTAHFLSAKKQDEDEKIVFLTLRDGRHLLVNRMTHSVLLGDDIRVLHAHSCRADSGYESLFAGLFEAGAELPPLLTVHAAMQVLRWTEDAMAHTITLGSYPKSSEYVPPGFGAIARARAIIRKWSAKPPPPSPPPAQWPPDVPPEPAGPKPGPTIPWPPRTAPVENPTKAKK